ncbi:uncharacterized protein TNCV_1809201 [Trichonephila clavipes]|nr:uncharacterized protein TNCV_1809201 [Trichonephila clavipes]
MVLRRLLQFPAKSGMGLQAGSYKVLRTWYQSNFGPPRILGPSTVRGLRGFSLFKAAFTKPLRLFGVGDLEIQQEILRTHADMESAAEDTAGEEKEACNGGVNNEENDGAPSSGEKTEQNGGCGDDNDKSIQDGGGEQAAADEENKADDSACKEEEKNSEDATESSENAESRENIDEEKPEFVEWAQNEIAVVPDFHKRNLFIDEAHFWLNGYVNKQSCRLWNEANPQVYVETPLHPEKLTVWCALWPGGILLQKR